MRKTIEMTESISGLLLAVLLFAGSHVGLAWPPVRQLLVKYMGELGFRVAYSALSVLLLFWVVRAYCTAPFVSLWHPPIGLMHLAFPLVLVACLLVAGGFTTPNPTAIGGERPGVLTRGPVGFVKLTRHPVMWGIALWAAAHLLANGDLASVLLFGGIGLLALAGAIALDQKKRVLLGDAWSSYAAQTSFVPLAAVIAGRTRVSLHELGWWRLALGLVLFGILFTAHPYLFGVSPLPY